MPTLISPPSVASQIFGNLYQGTLWNARQVGTHGSRYGLILNVTDETIPRIPGVEHFQLGLLDGHEIPHRKLDYAIRLLQDYFRSGYSKPALVCCHAGISRSSAIVFAYLLGIGMGFNEAEALLKFKRPEAVIHHMLMRSIKQHFGYAPRSEQDLIQGAVTQ